MIRPTKYTDLNISILNIASAILKIVKENKSLTYDELLDKLVDNLGERARFNFISSILFMYSLGLIDYSVKNDAFYYIQNKVNLNEAK